MSAAPELRRAMEALLEEGAAVRERPAPGYRGLLELYGSNAAIASAAGFPAAAEAVAAHRATYPHARPTTFARLAVDARRERQSFLRNLQRYARGERHPDELRPLLAKLRRRGMARLRREGVEFGGAVTLTTLARALVANGVTVPAGWWGLIAVSDDERERRPPGVMFYPPEDFATYVDEGAWAQAAAVFFDAWGQAYGVGFVDVLDAEELELVAGLAPNLASYGP